MANVMSATETNLLAGDQSMATAAITPLTTTAGGGGALLAPGGINPLTDVSVPGGDPGGTLQGYDPIVDPEVNLVNYGYFDGGSGADQYTGYQGDFGNYFDSSSSMSAGGPITLDSEININNDLGLGALQYAVASSDGAGNFVLGQEYLTNDYINILDQDPFLNDNGGGNVGQGFNELGARGELIGAGAAGAGLGAAIIFMNGPEGALLDPALTADGGVMVADGLKDIYTAASGPLDANEVTALNAVWRTLTEGVSELGSLINTAVAAGRIGGGLGIIQPFGSDPQYHSGPPAITPGYSLTGIVATGSSDALPTIALPSHPLSMHG